LPYPIDASAGAWQTREVTAPRVRSGLKEQRLRAGLQQRELADRVGVSRQTLSALEAGDTVPATSLALELARTLGCRVEDLFWLSDEESILETTLTNGERGDGRRRVALGSVDGRWVAHLLDGDGPLAFTAPADGLLMGREKKAAARVRSLRPAEALRQNVLVAGCDPALGLLAAHVADRFCGARLHPIEAGSGAALELLARGEVHVAGVHLYDEESGEHNVPAVRRRFGAKAMVLVNLAVWEQGLVVAPGNPRRIRGVADLARKGVRLVGREAGSGAHELLARLAADEGVARKALGLVGVARGHLAVASAVAAGAADVGVATRSVASSFGLEFIPLAEARFDLVFRQEARGEERIARVLDVLGSPRFRRDLGGRVGYGTGRTGQTIAEVTA
jgi:putative molybdopterin biosynthesis protein